MTVGFFLEDQAHENFIIALTLRILEELERENCRVINAVGGSSRVLEEYEKFMRDYSKGKSENIDLLIVVIDSNTEGPINRIRKLEKIREKYKYFGPICFAIPDPHIERWYLLDNVAFGKAVEINTPGEISAPPRRRTKDYYKNILMQILGQNDIICLAGGSEYGGEIANLMDLDLIRRKPNKDTNFIDFLDCLRQFNEGKLR